MAFLVKKELYEIDSKTGLNEHDMLTIMKTIEDACFKYDVIAPVFIKYGLCRYHLRGHKSGSHGKQYAPIGIVGHSCHRCRQHP